MNISQSWEILAVIVFFGLGWRIYRSKGRSPFYSGELKTLKRKRYIPEHEEYSKFEVYEKKSKEVKIMAWVDLVSFELRFYLDEREEKISSKELYRMFNQYIPSPKEAEEKGIEFTLVYAIREGEIVWSEFRDYDEEKIRLSDGKDYLPFKREEVFV